MAFGNFKSINAVRLRIPLGIANRPFIPESRLPVPEHLATNFAFALSRRGPSESEAFYTENFVYPVLQFCWMRHSRLHVWSHTPIEADGGLSGEPDYLVAAESEEVSNNSLHTPLLAVIEAKRQDFDEGWGQCLAAMLACQRLNEGRAVTVYGIVSTGLQWEFGKLEGDRFTRHTGACGLNDPPQVLGLVDELFAGCARQLDSVGQ